MRRVAFDVDCLLSDSRTVSEQPRAPVYIAGLARSGTTVLLQVLYASRAFATLTYRKMPFVTAPQLWSKFPSALHRTAEPRERAHGDRLHVGFDSPEAFEEPFWTMLTEGKFIRANGLDAHNIGSDRLADYRRYVANILAASKMPEARYLAKNNNNVLRIASLRRAFPDACILAPFRNPWDHARSLLSQHRRFCALHAEDPATLSYMNWLGHFEFGANFKPFNVDPEAPPRDGEEADTPDYWVRYWRCVYRYLLRRHERDVMFFDYDRFCREPVRTLERLAAAIDLEPARLTAFAHDVQDPPAHPREEGAGEAASEAADLYAALQEKSLQAV